jgi:hypothetical protein
MYPAAQAFVLNPFVRRVLFCVPFWVICVVLTWQSMRRFQANPDIFPYLLELFPFLLENQIPTIQSFYFLFLEKILGNGTVVIQVAAMPFKIGLVWQLMTLGEKVLGPFKAPIFVLASMIVLYPTFSLSYFFLINHIVWLFFFFTVLNEIYPLYSNLKRRNLITTLSLIGLFLTGLEGVITTCLLLIFDILSNYLLERKEMHPLSIFNENRHIKTLPDILKPYLWSCFISIIYIIILHKNADIFSTSDYGDVSRYVQSVLDSKAGLKTFAIISHVVLLGIMVFCFQKIGLTNLLPNSRLISLLLGLIVFSNFLLHQNVISYNLLILNLLCLKLISDLKTSKIQSVLYLGVFIALLLSFFSR